VHVVPACAGSGEGSQTLENRGSMKTMINLSNSDMKTEFMRYMKCAGVFVNLNDMTRYSYMPYLVEKAVLGIYSARILI
jgi:hypothetical protein